MYNVMYCDVLSMETGDTLSIWIPKESNISPDLWHLLTRCKARAWLQHSFFAWHGQATWSLVEVEKPQGIHGKQHSKWQMVWKFWPSRKLLHRDALCFCCAPGVEENNCKRPGCSKPSAWFDFCTVLPHVMLSCSPPRFYFCLVLV